VLSSSSSSPRRGPRSQTLGSCPLPVAPLVAPPCSHRGAQGGQNRLGAPLVREKIPDREAVLPSSRLPPHVRPQNLLLRLRCVRGLCLPSSHNRILPSHYPTLQRSRHRFCTVGPSRSRQPTSARRPVCPYSSKLRREGQPVRLPSGRSYGQCAPMRTARAKAHKCVFSRSCAQLSSARGLGASHRQLASTASSPAGTCCRLRAPVHIAPPLSRPQAGKSRGEGQPCGCLQYTFIAVQSGYMPHIIERCLPCRDDVILARSACTLSRLARWVLAPSG